MKCISLLNSKIKMIHIRLKISILFQIKQFFSPQNLEMFLRFKFSYVLQECWIYEKIKKLK